MAGSIIGTPVFTDTGGDPTNVTVTVPSGCAKAVFAWAQHDTFSYPVIGVTLDGNACTRVDGSGDASPAVEMWYIDSPAAGTVTLSIDQTTNVYVGITEIYLSGVAAGAPESSAKKVFQTTTSHTLATTVGAVVVEVASQVTGDASFVAAGGLTAWADQAFSSNSWNVACGTLIADATSETPDFGAGSDADACSIAASFAPSGGGGTFLRTYFHG